MVTIYGLMRLENVIYRILHINGLNNYTLLTQSTTNSSDTIFSHVEVVNNIKNCNRKSKNPTP